MSKRITKVNTKCVCEVCGAEFTASKNSSGRFCSRACYRDSVDIAGSVERLAPNLVDNAVATGPAIVAADWHIPFIHVPIWNRLLELQERTGITQLDIPGDWMDNRAFSPHPGSKVEKHKPSLDLAYDILEELAGRFEVIRLSPGNHDRWLTNCFSGQFEHHELVDMLFRDFVRAGKLRVVSVPYIQRKDGGAHFIVVHQKTFSGANPHGVALDLEAHRDIFRDKHVITTHGHLEVLGRNATGKYLAAQLGCMTDNARTRYIQEYITRHREWNPGFGVIAKGYLWLVNDIMPDAAFNALCEAVKVNRLNIGSSKRKGAGK